MCKSGVPLVERPDRGLVLEQHHLHVLGLDRCVQVLLLLLQAGLDEVAGTLAAWGRPGGVSAGQGLPGHGLGQREALVQARDVVEPGHAVEHRTHHEIDAGGRVWATPQACVDGPLDGLDGALAQGSDHPGSVGARSLGVLDQLHGQLDEGSGQPWAQEECVGGADERGDVREGVVRGLEGAGAKARVDGIDRQLGERGPASVDGRLGHAGSIGQCVGAQPSKIDLGHDLEGGRHDASVHLGIARASDS